MLNKIIGLYILRGPIELGMEPIWKDSKPVSFSGVMEASPPMDLHYAPVVKIQ